MNIQELWAKKIELVAKLDTEYCRYDALVAELMTDDPNPDQQLQHCFCSEELDSIGNSIDKIEKKLDNVNTRLSAALRKPTTNPYQRIQRTYLLNLDVAEDAAQKASNLARDLIRAIENTATIHDAFEKERLVATEIFHAFETK